MVTSTEVGKKVVLKILRDGKEEELTVKIGKHPEKFEELEEERGEASFRGMEVEDITPFYQRRYRIRENEGVVIVYIEEDSPAEKAGLEVGDVILKIEGKRIRNKEDFISVTSKIKGSCLIKTNRGYFVVKEE
jgi:serine protease Do